MMLESGSMNRSSKLWIMREVRSRAYVRPFRWIVIRILLLRTFLKMLVNQIHLKLTKFTRRAREPKDFWQKFVSGAGFLLNILRYNLDVIRCSQRCLKRLAARQVYEVSVYGERHIVEILQELALESPVRITRVYGASDDNKHNADFLEASTRDREEIIIASLVDIDCKRERLRNLGIDEDRIVVLV
jgi:hypothetical protein